jgi:ribonuclease P protein component
MLPSNRRLSRQQFTDFLETKPLQVYNRLGTFKYLSVGNKLSIVTSSKHEKKAVSRNKLRRRIYTIFSTTNPPLSGILYVSKQSYAFPYDETKNLFLDLLARAQKNS